MKENSSDKLYDTNTATLISGYSYGNSGDLDYVSETLYQKKSGELFLYGVGGAMTCYSNPCGNNSWTGGEAIMPASQFDVKDWVAEHCDVDTYVKLFGDVAE